MVRKLGLLAYLTLLSGCSFMPGMHNPNVSRMTVVHAPKITIHPILVPITPQTVEQEAISN